MDPIDEIKRELLNLNEQMARMDPQFAQCMRHLGLPDRRRSDLLALLASMAEGVGEQSTRAAQALANLRE